MSFSLFDFHPQIAANIEAVGYVSPTPIQEQAIPFVLKGRDVMGLAQTGTGKTAAFLLPILDRFIRNPGPRHRIRALVVAPTRELAEQIHESARDLGRDTGIRSATVYGGVSMGPQLQALKGGAEIIVACPGRLLDHMGQKAVDLSAVEVLVLDEADHMLDMGFMPDIRKILAALPAKRQTLLFSATMPATIRQFAGDVLTDPVTVRLGEDAPAETVDHALYQVDPSRKTPLLLELLRRAGNGSVLVFTRTKHRAKRLALQLEKAGFRAASLQGNLSQNRRQAALNGFRDGEHQILVATDIAARGIDVIRVEHVINYDMPDTAEAYTHRIGRTGRAERTGMAHSLVTPEDTDMIRAIERYIGKPLPRRTLDGFDYTPGETSREFDRPPRQPRPGGRSVARPRKPAAREKSAPQARPSAPAAVTASSADSESKAEAGAEAKSVRSRRRRRSRSKKAVGTQAPLATDQQTHPADQPAAKSPKPIRKPKPESGQPEKRAAQPESTQGPKRPSAPAPKRAEPSRGQRSRNSAPVRADFAGRGESFDVEERIEPESRTEHKKSIFGLSGPSDDDAAPARPKRRRGKEKTA